MQKIRSIATLLLVLLSISVMTMPSSAITEQSKASFREGVSLTVFVKGEIFAHGSWNATRDVTITSVNPSIFQVDLVIVTHNIVAKDWDATLFGSALPQERTETVRNAIILNGTLGSFPASYVVWTGTPVGTFTPLIGQDYSVTISKPEIPFSTDTFSNSITVIEVKSTLNKARVAATEEAIYDSSSGFLLSYKETKTITSIGDIRVVEIRTVRLIDTNVADINPDGTISSSPPSSQFSLDGSNLTLIGLGAAVLILLILIGLILRGRRSHRRIRTESPLDDRSYSRRDPPPASSDRRQFSISSPSFYVYGR